MEEARFTMRIHPIIMNKMKHIAKNNGRSLNKEIEQILKWIVDDYERKCGRINLDEDELPPHQNNNIHPFTAEKMDMLFKLDKTVK